MGCSVLPLLSLFASKRHIEPAGTVPADTICVAVAQPTKELQRDRSGPGDKAAAAASASSALLGMLLMLIGSLCLLVCIAGWSWQYGAQVSGQRIKIAGVHGMLLRTKASTSMRELPDKNKHDGDNICCHRHLKYSGRRPGY